MEAACSRTLTRRITLLVWVSVFIVYQTTFISTPRLFVSPETGWFYAAVDIPEHALALRGSPNETDMRKHLLYAPIGQMFYRAANRLRLLLGIPYDTVALVFPQALYGATSVAVAYLLFLRLINGWRLAAIAACCYAFTYLMWLMSSVSESYALTTLSVNIFLFFILREKVASWSIWCLITIVLITLCSLCDLRFISLIILPLYIAGRAPGLKPAKRIGLMCAIVVGMCCLAGLAYTFYQQVAGREAFGISAMWNWLWIYRQKNIAGHHIFDFHSIISWMRVLFNELISPYYRGAFNYCPDTIQKIHTLLVYCFRALAITLIIVAIRSIRRSILSSFTLRALLYWLIAHFIQLQLVSAGMGLAHAAPLLLPIMVLIVPGVVRSWEPLRFGKKTMAIAVAIMLSNNLILMNEARLAWQRPAIVQSHLDRIYLLPGEIERAQFLKCKISSFCSPSEATQLNALAAKAPQGLSAKERSELNEIFFEKIEHLTQSERGQLQDITYRRLEAARQAEKACKR